jgi:hypothetical protein
LHAFVAAVIAAVEVGLEPTDFVSIYTAPRSLVKVLFVLCHTLEEAAVQQLPSSE